MKDLLSPREIAKAINLNLLFATVTAPICVAH